MRVIGVVATPDTTTGSMGKITLTWQVSFPLIGVELATLCDFVATKTGQWPNHTKMMILIKCILLSTTTIRLS